MVSSESISTFPSSTLFKQKTKHQDKMIKQHEKIVSFIVFLFIGTSSALGWNVLVNSLFSIRSKLFPLGIFNEPITASYNISVLLGALFLLKFGALRPVILLGGLVGSALTSLIFYRLCFLIHNASAAFILSIVSSTLGFCVAFALGGSFAFASNSSSNSTAVCTGMGLAGLISFAIWLFLSRFVFSLTTDLEVVVMILTGIQCLVAFIAVCGAIAIGIPKENWNSGTKNGRTPINLTVDEESPNRKESLTNDNLHLTDNEVLSQVNDFIPHNPNDINNDFHDETNTVHVDCITVTLPYIRQQNYIGAIENNETSWKYVLLSCLPNVITLLITLAFTFYLFPNIWPLSWRSDHTSLWSDILTGVFQLGDFVGRLLPVVFNPLSSKSTLYLSVIRILIYIPICIVLSPVIATRSTWIIKEFNPWMKLLLMLGLATTNGFIATLGSVHCVRCVDSPRAKTRASSLALIGTVGGVAFGSALSVLNPVNHL